MDLCCYRKFIFLCMLFLVKYRYYCLFQYFEKNQEKSYANPLEWKTLFKLYAYIEPVMIICRLLNCSLDFYAYVFLRYHNRRAETRRKQKRQEEREMKMVNQTQMTYESNLETA